MPDDPVAAQVSGHDNGEGTRVQVAVTISPKAIPNADERQRCEEALAYWLAEICKAALPMAIKSDWIGPYRAHWNAGGEKRSNTPSGASSPKPRPSSST